MISGGWRAILSDDHGFYVRLAQFCDFLIEVRERGFEGFAVIGIGGGCEVVGDPRARQLQIPGHALPDLLIGALCFRAGGVFLAFIGFNLYFDAFAFPSSRHTYSLT